MFLIFSRLQGEAYGSSLYIFGVDQIICLGRNGQNYQGKFQLSLNMFEKSKFYSCCFLTNEQHNYLDI